VHTPRCWGFDLRAGALVLVTLGERPLRTNWLIVGTTTPWKYCTVTAAIDDEHSSLFQRVKKARVQLDLPSQASASLMVAGMPWGPTVGITSHERDPVLLQARMSDVQQAQRLN
jgi:hypothetical protein